MRWTAAPSRCTWDGLSEVTFSSWCKQTHSAYQGVNSEGDKSLTKIKKTHSRCPLCFLKLLNNIQERNVLTAGSHWHARIGSGTLWLSYQLHLCYTVAAFPCCHNSISPYNTPITPFYRSLERQTINLPTSDLTHWIAAMLGESAH